MTRLGSRGWAIVAVSLSVGALVAVSSDSSSALRPLVVAAFLLFVPGTALVRLFGFRELAVDVALGCALSVALAGAVAGALLVIGRWTPSIGLAVLVTLTIGAVGVELGRRTATTHGRPTGSGA